jgi:DNA-binding CsgD family transcriptional regulator
MMASPARSTWPEDARPDGRLITIAVVLRRALPCDAVAWASLEPRCAMTELVVWPGDEVAPSRVRKACAVRVGALLDRLGVVGRRAGEVRGGGSATLADLPLDAAHLLCLPVAKEPAQGWIVARAAQPFRQQELDIADMLVHGIRAQASVVPAVRLTRPAQGTDTGDAIALTAREREILDLVGQGLTAAAIGRRTGISVRTVHKHLQHTYAKLGCNDRLSAIIRIGSLSPST